LVVYIICINDASSNKYQALLEVQGPRGHLQRDYLECDWKSPKLFVYM